MKIFALNLSLEFEVNDPSRTYDVEPITFDELMGYLFKGVEFDKQRFYVMAEYSESFVQHVFDLQAHDVWRNLELNICFRFDKKHQYDAFIDDFWELFREVDAAGGLVTNENGDYLCIYNRGRWTLPKGGVEWREEIVDAAMREVREETGILEVEVKEEIGETFHTFRRGKLWMIKITHWFAMEASSEAELSPQTEEFIEKAVWMPREEWLEKAADSTFPLIRHVFERAFAQSLLA